jgi:hypothetical protein
MVEAETYSRSLSNSLEFRICTSCNVRQAVNLNPCAEQFEDRFDVDPSGAKQLSRCFDVDSSAEQKSASQGEAVTVDSVAR